MNGNKIRLVGGRVKNKVFSLREQQRVLDEWLIDRLDNILPAVMKRTGFDMWIIVTDECNEDPMTKTFLPARLNGASRKMILVFSLDETGAVTRETISKPSGLEDIYVNSWYGFTDTDWKGKKFTPPTIGQFEYLREYVARKNPKKIGINTDEAHYYCDGLSHTNYLKMTEALGEEYTSRLCSSRDLAIAWMETRSEKELAAYDGIVQIAHAIISDAFSGDLITPGVTTNDDLRFYMMQSAADMNILYWFDCTVAIFRKNKPGMHNSTMVIMPGDVVHCDYGIQYLGLCTDCQKLCYVLKRSETDAPEGLKNAMRITNRLQDIVAGTIKVGKTGNEALREARAEALANGIEPCVYTHPIGIFGHGPGPSIGLFTNQEGDAHGENRFNNDTLYALELNAKVAIPEWDNEVLMCCLETEIMFTNDTVYFMGERQTEFYLVK